mmetsp:Transcript_76175/g.217573  ORF Transcript_76175/g.217573 Transcript_76175/m.217573 type:complete len:179 (+) Transcript_76175:501-1037(+)
MDPQSRQMRGGLSIAMAEASGAAGAEAAALQAEIGKCLQMKCQREVGKCKASNGPCPQPAGRMVARRACRPIKQELMAGLEEFCTGRAERVVGLTFKAAGANPQTDKLADQLGFPQSYSEMVLGLVNKCRHSEADNDPNYINCFETALEKHMVSCAVEKCLAPATNCAKTACRMDGVL